MPATRVTRSDLMRPPDGPIYGHPPVQLHLENTRMSFNTLRRTTAVLAATLVGACSDATAPTIDNVDASAATAAAAPTPPSPRLTKAAARGQWDGLAPSLARSAARSADVVPIEVRGNMYVY